LDSWYDKFAFTFDRVAMDYLLRQKAEEAGAEYRVGKSVKSVETTNEGGKYKHTLKIGGGESVEADYLVLADGPQRRVTIPTLQQFADGDLVSEKIGPANANHIAYQEYRRLPDEIFEDDVLRFWWGYMPGETTYPWYFPYADNVVEFGLTMPINLDLSTVENRDDYLFLHDDDERVPSGGEYIKRLLEHVYGDEYDIENDLPLVEERGKKPGTETYPISSTDPIDSPVHANIAAVGGAMGGTSAFHEGGYHIAMGTGKTAGRLIARGRIDEYNREWKKGELGREIHRNVCLAHIVRDYKPDDWDSAFRSAEISRGNMEASLLERVSSTVGMFKILAKQKYLMNVAKKNYVQINESDYTV
ncbi:MAG: NAD(P)/FAD-dependent oxidoreductase, partial [Halobacteria archaeon]|nr:NAD(P)/FAD-dependent oxidoreductase [Halobacteria archaeon]